MGRFAILAGGILLMFAGLCGIELGHQTAGGFALVAGLIVAGGAFIAIAGEKQKAERKEQADMAELAQNVDKPGTDESWVHEQFGRSNSGSQ